MRPSRRWDTNNAVLLPRGVTARHAWYPVPGWLGDPLPRLRKFERWLRRGPVAHRLYWRTHPELYQRMLKDPKAAAPRPAFTQGATP